MPLYIRLCVKQCLYPLYNFYHKLNDLVFYIFVLHIRNIVFLPCNLLYCLSLHFSVEVVIIQVFAALRLRLHATSLRQKRTPNSIFFFVQNQRIPIFSSFRPKKTPHCNSLFSGEMKSHVDEA